jgi:hypothetical protein
MRTQEAGKRGRERSQNWGNEVVGKVPGTRCCGRPEHWEPERDCICLRSVGKHYISEKAFFRKRRRAPGHLRALWSERFDHRQSYDQDQ